jgi:hypothetical protein
MASRRPTKTTACRILSLLLAACIPALLLDAAPASASECPAIPGMKEKECKPYKPTPYMPKADKTPTYWYDTDGIDPEVAGCHVEVTGPTAKPGDKASQTGRTFGEACVPAQGVILVESNPGADVVHAHADDIGNPNYVNCNTWCKEVKAKGSGQCQWVDASPADPKVAPCTRSAKCVCK